MKKLTTVLLSVLVSFSSVAAQDEQKSENYQSGLDKAYMEVKDLMEKELPRIYVGTLDMREMFVTVSKNGKKLPVKGDLKISFEYWDSGLKVYGLSRENLNVLLDMAVIRSIANLNYKWFITRLA